MQMTEQPHIQGQNPMRNTEGSGKEDLEEDRGSIVVGTDEANAVARKKRTVKLKDILKSKTEFDGFGGLALFFLYVVITAILIAMYLPNYAGTARAISVLQMQSYTSVDGNDVALADQMDAVSVTSYFTGAARAMITASETNGVPNEGIKLATFPVKGIMLGLKYIVEEKRNGHDILGEDGFELAKNTLLYSMKEDDKFAEYAMNSTYTVKHEIVGVQNPLDTKIPIFFNPQSRSHALKVLDWIDDTFLPAVAPTLYLVDLLMFVQNPAVPDDASHMIIPFSDAQKKKQYTTLPPTLFTGGSLTWTVPIRMRSYYGNSRDFIRLLIEIAWLFLSIKFAVEERLDYKITTAKHAGEKAYFVYLSSPWNFLDALSLIITGWVFIAHFIALAMTEQVFSRGTWPKTVEQWTRLQVSGVVYQILFYSQVINFLFLGARLFKFFRFHLGTGVYIAVFERSWEAMQDFMVWFFTVIVWLTLFFFFLFACTGGNLSFATMSNSLNVIGLFTFGYYDYDGVYNGGLGFGNAPFMITLVSWLMIALMIMFANNIILAIVANAYDLCSEDAAGCPSFFTLSKQRVRFAIERWSGRNPGVQHRPQQKRRSTVMGALVPEASSNAVRWRALSSSPSVDMLYHYFQSSLDMKPVMKSYFWDNGSAIERAHESLLSISGNPLAGNPKKHPGAAEILNVPLDLVQLTAIMEEICNDTPVSPPDLKKPGKHTNPQFDIERIKWTFGDLFRGEFCASRVPLFETDRTAETAEKLFEAFATVEEDEEKKGEEKTGVPQKMTITEDGGSGGMFRRKKDLRAVVRATQRLESRLSAVESSLEAIDSKLDAILQKRKGQP